MPKKTGGVMGLEPNETLAVINPELASDEAEADGLAIKRMIATGVGIPMHYFAEPEGSTRTTAEAAGTPTFKRFERRQEYLVGVVRTLLLTVVELRRKYRVGTVKRVDIIVNAPDVTEKDNANLAIAVQRVTAAFAPIYNAKLISPKEFIRLVYRFVAETPPETIGKFSPINLRGGTGREQTPLPNKDPSDPTKNDLGTAD
jgi:hypothetical protein